MKKQFTSFHDNNYKLWYRDDDMWSEDTSNIGAMSDKPCHSLKAFKRNLKHIANKQPELAGHEFRLCNKFYGTTKSGNHKSFDIVMKVKGSRMPLKKFIKKGVAKTPLADLYRERGI